MPKRTLTRLTKKAIDDAGPGSWLWDVEVPGFGVRVGTTGTKSFIFQYRTRTGEQGKITIGRFPSLTVEQARKEASKHRSHVDTGGNPSADRRSTREAPTLADAARYYCDEYAIGRALKPSTISEAQRVLNWYALPKFGIRKIAEITVADVRKMQAEANMGSGRYQANRLRAVLSRMFTLAIQNGWRTDNPCKGVEKYPEDQRWDHLSPGQVALLLEACDRHADQALANAIRLLLFTGARSSEVRTSEWSQFDLSAGVWTKPSSHTKTNIRHRVQLADPAVKMLIEMQAEAMHNRYLFPGRTGDKPRADLKMHWKKMRDDAGLQGFRPHDLRRTNASFMLSTGSDLSAVGKTLGHTQASTTARYAQLFDDVQRKGVNRAVDVMLRPGDGKKAA